MLLPINESGDLIDVSESAMLDRCVIQDNSPIKEPSGQEVDSWVDRANETPCRFSLGGAQQTSRTRDSEVSRNISAARLSLPLGTSVDSTNRIKLTSILGNDISPMIFDIDGEPLPGATALIVRLRRIDT